MNNTYVLYHKNCLDGFMSAAIAYSKLGEGTEYIGVNHQQPLPEMEKGSIIYLVDFAYPREITLELQRCHQEIIILDHHKTAQEQLLGIKGISALFDLTTSLESILEPWWGLALPLLGGRHSRLCRAYQS